MPIITGQALAAWLVLPDSQDQTNCDLAAAAASKWVHTHCGAGREFTRTEIASASARKFRPDSIGFCYVDDFWETTGLVVKTDTDGDGTFETTWTLNTDYFVEPLNGLRNGEPSPYYQITPAGYGKLFPWPVNNRPTVQVTAAWGWSAIPEDVTTAALLEGARLFERRNSPVGVLGGFGEFTARVSQYADPDAVRLLKRYRRTDLFGVA